MKYIFQVLNSQAIAKLKHATLIKRKKNLSSNSEYKAGWAGAGQIWGRVKVLEVPAAIS